MRLQSNRTDRYALLIGYARREWRVLTAIGVLMLATSVVAALQPLPMKMLVDYGLRGLPMPYWLQAWCERLGARSTGALVLFAAILAIGAIVLQNVVSSAMTWAWSVAGQRMVYNLTSDLFQKLLRLSLRYHSRTPVGDSISRLTGDTWSVYSFVSGFLLGPVHQIFIILSVGMVAFSLDRGLAGVSVAMAPLLALSSVYFGGRLKIRARQTRQADASLLSFVHQTLTALPTVQTFAVESRNRQRYTVLADEAIAISRKGALLSSSYGMVNGVIATLGSAVILFVGGKRVLDGHLPLGSLLVFLSYMQTLHTCVEGLLKLYGGFKPLEASIERITDTMLSPEFLPEPAHPIEIPGARSEAGMRVTFENVTFGYQEQRPILRNVGFEAQPGETIALVGRTGAGKSTLISLIPRLYDPWSGAVKLAGCDIRSLKIADVRRRVSVLLQEPFLFPLSIADNIGLGRAGARRDEIVEAARSAGAHDFIQALPAGYDTVLGERGAQLSGGERQRIAIARAFLKDAPVLILDEPSSALDAQTEKALLDALDRLLQGRTVFIIAHRLSTVREADRIIVLSNGVIAESGTHEVLLAAGGEYAGYCAARFERTARGVPT